MSSRIVTFLSPHPGTPLSGAAVPPPTRLVQAAAVLNDLKMDLDSAKELLRAICQPLKLGPIEVRDNAILVFSGNPGGNETLHVWRIICFKP